MYDLKEIIASSRRLAAGLPADYVASAPSEIAVRDAESQVLCTYRITETV